MPNLLASKIRRKTPLDRKIQELSSFTDKQWNERGEAKALALFHRAAVHVPAYKQFLLDHGVDVTSVRNIEDFAKVPFVTKDNYLRKYKLSDLSWNGDVSTASMINRSSGSSGKPFYWLSNQSQRSEVGEFYNIVFNTMFNMGHKKTLVIVAYGMGSWVAGTTTLLSTIEFMNQHNCTVMTPGYNRKEVIEICNDVGHEYEQIVICAYPPLVKEIIDLGVKEGLDWKRLKPKFIFGAEAFTEEFRDYVLSKVGSKNFLLDTMNTIGSADAMVIGHETPLSISLRKSLMDTPDLHDSILGNGRIPTVAQYYPWQKYLETEKEELLITSDGAIPLIRYNIQDKAKVYSYDDLEKKVHEYGGGSLVEALPREMQDSYNWKLPFVMLYGKSTNAVKFYGAFVYPENIKLALENSEYASRFTGKFKMETYLDKSRDQRLRLHLELAPGVELQEVTVGALQKDISKTIASCNSEYRCVYTDIGKKTRPMIKLAMYGEFDLAGGSKNKHRYT